MAPSLLNILQAKAGGEKANVEPSLSSAGQSARPRRVGGADLEPTRKIVKMENTNQLTYKNLNRNMIQNLRRRLNRVPSSSELGAGVRQTSAGVVTPCKFLSGYRSSGRCTEVRSCRVGDIEYLNNVRQIEAAPGASR